MLALVHRCLQCTARVLVNSYLSYAPGPAAHVARRPPHLRVRARSQSAPHARGRGPAGSDARIASPSSRCCSRSPIPYGFLPGQLPIVLRYVQEYAHWAKLTDVAPVHRMAKAVAIVPRRPRLPAVLGEQGRLDRGQQALPADLRPRVPDPGAAARARSGGDVPPGIGKDPGARPRLHHAAQAAPAPVGDSARATVQSAFRRAPGVVTCAGMSACGNTAAASTPV
jgi:hypothetical protein